MATYLVTGASRGIGLELVKQLRARGDAVIGTVRSEKDADAIRALGAEATILDVGDEASIDTFAAGLRTPTVRPIDVLINNAGVFPREQDTLESLRSDTLVDAFRINAVAPVFVTRALLPNLLAGQRRLVVHISTIMGSLASTTSSGAYPYRASKAALNMLHRASSVELGTQGLTCVAVHPGWVRTDMGGAEAHLAPEESVSGILRLIANAGPAHHAGYFDYAGKALPW